MAKVLLSMTLVEYMKDSGSMIKEMAEDSNCSQMEISFRESIKQEKLMVKVTIHGVTVKFMMASGKTDKRRDMVSGEVFTETVTSANGLTIKQRVMVCTPGSMEIGMRVSGKPVFAMATVRTSSQTVIFMSVSTLEVNLKDMVNISGQMEILTVAISTMA